MNRRSLSALLSLALIGPAMVVLPALLTRGEPAIAQEAITVPLEPAAGSEVSGSATLTGRDGATRVELEVTGLTPGTGYVSRLHAGTCDRPSASFAALPALEADAGGRASASGPVRFRDAADIPLSDLTDGDHIIVVAGPDAVVACGSVPIAGMSVGSRQAAGALLRDLQGEVVGEASFTQMGGRVLVEASVRGLPPGFHGFHVHGTGVCDPTGGFMSAGGHLNPSGEAHPEHAGDQPILYVLADGTGFISFWTDRYSVSDLTDAGGAALIVHALADNFANIPQRYAPDGPDEMTRATGDAGGRLACGVIQTGK